MSFFTDTAEDLQALQALLGDVSTDVLPSVMRGMGASRAHDVVVRTQVLIGRLAVLQSCAAAVIAEASSRDAGQNGFAQGKGHRSPVSLVQEITGSTRADAVKQIRAGESLLDAAVPAPVPEVDETPVEPPVLPWHAPADDALLHGTITVEQHDAIRRGLGTPPAPTDADLAAAALALSAGSAVAADADTAVGSVESGGVEAGEAAADAGVDAAVLAYAIEIIEETWRVAAEQLVDEAAHRTVEELRTAARTVRDVIDPAGAARRHDERHEARSCKTWKDAAGIKHAHMRFDDDGAALFDTLHDGLFRSRTGGPRFVDPDDIARSENLLQDPRTNEQLAYDLFIDVMRAGMRADPVAVFGTRQAGVRMIITQDVLDADAGGDSAPGVGILEDGGQTLPAWLVAQQVCDVGTVPVTTDSAGNPLNLGRTQRLFSAKQRIALALRDGGCRWKGCDRPASYCEAHHIDPWSQQGRTDIDRGILLCRFHHMNLHHHGWRITRHELHEFVLHPPGGAPPIPLPRRIGLRYVLNTPPPTPHPAVA